MAQRSQTESGLLSWEESFELKLAKTVDTLVQQTTTHIGKVQKRSLRERVHREEIIAEAIKRVARELYGHQVKVTFTKPREKGVQRSLRFVVSCERGDSRLEVFPKRLER